MNTTTLNQPIVIDNGTGVMKAGFGGYVINSLLLNLKKKDIPSLTYITHSYTGMINLNVFFMHLLDDQNIHE